MPFFLILSQLGRCGHAKTRGPYVAAISYFSNQHAGYRSGAADFTECGLA